MSSGQVCSGQAPLPMAGDAAGAACQPRMVPTCVVEAAGYPTVAMTRHVSMTMQVMQAVQEAQAAQEVRVQSVQAGGAAGVEVEVGWVPLVEAMEAESMKSGGMRVEAIKAIGKTRKEM